MAGTEIQFIKFVKVDTFDDVFLLIGGKWLQISASDYVFTYQGVCVLAFVPSQQSYWLIGSTLMKGYYTIHDNNDKS